MKVSAPVPSRTGLEKWLVRVGSMLAVVLVSIFSAYILQRSTHLEWHRRIDTDITLSRLDVLLLVVLTAGLWSIFGRVSWALATVAGGSLLIGAINNAKVQLRREPVYPSDTSFVSETNSIASMVDGGSAWSVLLPVLATVVAIVGIGMLLSRRFPRTPLRSSDGGLNRGMVGSRLVVFALSTTLLLHASAFNEPGNLWRAAYDRSATWKPWDQVHNYRTNGFVGGFLYNMPVDPMPRPTEYSAEEMTRLSERYTQRANKINAGRHGSLSDVNVVFVLAESFSDPSWMEGFTLEQNPIPRTQQVMDETISGGMYTTGYGGGTSTMEFESLTGQPVGLFQPQVSSPYQNFVSDRPDYPSAVGAFNGLGHRTIAIHPYNLDMYKRVAVYETLGFDQVIDQNAMHSTDKIATSRYISDASAFDETLRQIDQNRRPVFVNLVTMQNHGAYHGSYPDPIGSDIADPDVAEKVEQYSRGLAHTDEALAGFLHELRQRNEKTVVVFYGDHHPGIYGDALMKRNESGALFRIPFFVWNSETNRAQHVEAVTPAMLLPLLYEAADAPVPPYVALLDDVRRKLPVIQHARALDADGKPADINALDPATAALINDLRMVQYDFAVGQRYGLEVMWPGALGESDLLAAGNAVTQGPTS
ncbi:LTA synthase family protein [Enemella sp. A6]|uniref:LTA synthase family protein n=1 Tax=Enemella sp. A6 TaxID=3440152 RepID=UPI003EBDAE56